ncbi:DUF1381 domain-containing protein [Staphylococcus xylosus]|uniref:DUF1381 domain-containing protein n=1 Tax=Staphylococcus xylosus TaxID=1288 RepID=UPI00034CBD6B|nr:DUF1381 domain-containing protein [Staphylococcus xylosus]
MQHLIRTLTDSTGHTFTHITQARENETFTVVEAESKEEAKRIAEYKNISEHFIELSLRKDSE